MKKSLLALAVLSTIPGLAAAQSSVTLSGNIDAGIVRANDQTTLRGAASGRNAVSLAGVEDLGGGLKAGFFLNHRFDVGTGNINSTATRPGVTTFWRQGWVQLISNFGDVRIGKMLPPLQEFNGGYEPWAGGDTVGNVHTGGQISGAVDARYSKAVYYRTPSLGGLQVHAMVAAGEDQGTATSPERPVGIGVQYAAGPLSVAIAGEKNQNDLSSLGVYGKYNFGVATVMAQFESDEGAGAAAPKQKSYSVGATVPFGAATGKIGYLKRKEQQIKKFGIGLDYSLSKRTFLYTDAGKFSGNGVSAIGKKTQFDVGVSHKF